MKRKIKEGTENAIWFVFLQDATSTEGDGLTGVTHNSSGLTWYWVAEGDPTETQVTLAAGTKGTYISGSLVEWNSSTLPGLYQICPPNEMVDATSNGHVVSMLKGATNMAPVPFEIELDAIDYQDGVRAGLTALPNAAADAAGGLPISDAGGLDLDALLADTDYLQQLLAELVTGSSPNRAYTEQAVSNVSGAALSQSDIDSIVAAVQAVSGNIQAALNASTITIYRASYLSQQFTSLGALTGRSDLIWQLKTRSTDADSAALLTVSENNGLTRLNGATSGLTASDASLTVTDAAAGDVTLTLKSSLTAQLVIGTRWDGIKVMKTDEQDTEVRRGRTTIEGARVEAVTE